MLNVWVKGFVSDKTLRLYVSQQKKEFDKLVRKKHRIVRQNVFDNILEAGKHNPEEFWKPQIL